MSDLPPIPLTYGDAVTRRGITCRSTAEGIVVTVPYRNELERRLVEGTSPLLQPIQAAIEFSIAAVARRLGREDGDRLAAEWFRREPALEVEVTASDVLVTECDAEGHTTRHAWPRGSVAEGHTTSQFRPNRFEPSIWIRVTDRAVLDVGRGLDRTAAAFVCGAVSPFLPNASQADGGSPLD